MHDVVLALLLGAAAIPANLIVWLYWKARWWSTPLGRGMAVTAASVALILDLVMVVRIFPSAAHSVRLVLTVLYLALSAGLWMKYRAFRALERERLDELRGIVQRLDTRQHRREGS